MPTVEVVRAWTDETYRQSLTPEELLALPAHPAGDVEAEIFEPLEQYLAVSPRDTCTCTTHSPRPCCF